MDPRSLLREHMLTLCDELEGLDQPVLADAIAEVRGSMSQPLRLAVVGRVKAGKSTLVNALIGRQVAPTSDEECTRVVTWYTYGSPERAELVLLDGSTLPVPFDGALPDDLGVAVEAVSHAVVYLQEGALREFVLIDTPGLATTTVENEEATRRQVLGDDAATRADALIYVFRDVQRADDIEFLEEFNRMSGDAERTSTTSIGVLSHADDFAEGPWGSTDPIDLASGYAVTIARQRASQLGAVVSVAGKLGEAARTGLVTEALARSMAKAAPLSDRQLEEPDAALDAIAAALGDYGLRHGRAHAGAGAAGLSAWLLERSGVARLQQLIRARYLDRYPHVKAAHSLARFELLAYEADNRREVREIIEQARAHAALHPLRELAALESVSTRRSAGDIVATLERLIDAPDDRRRVEARNGADSTEIAERARELAIDAQREATLAGTSVETEAWRVIARSYLLAAQRQG